MSSQPKPPTARTTRPPPPSAGAQRYKNFETPKQSANATAQEGADARRSTYEAWEHMRNNRAPPPPPPTSGRPGPEGSKFKPTPKSARPVYEEFRKNYNSPGASPNRRAQSSSASNRKGFVPTTPGGDESPAPKGAYFTARKSSQAPPPPPRNNPAPPAPENSVSSFFVVSGFERYRKSTTGYCVTSCETFFRLWIWNMANIEVADSC